MTLPPPEATTKLTASPATGFPYWSWSRTRGATATAVPTVADWLSPPVLVICVAAPATPVALIVTGVSVPADACSVFSPAAVPSVQLPTHATPEAFVTWVVPPALPPPPVTVNVTDKLATPVPPASSAFTHGGDPTAVFTVADWLSPEFTVSAVGTCTTLVLSCPDAVSTRAVITAGATLSARITPAVVTVTAVTSFDDQEAAGDWISESRTSFTTSEAVVSRFNAGKTRLLMANWTLLATWRTFTSSWSVMPSKLAVTVTVPLLLAVTSPAAVTDATVALGAENVAATGATAPPATFCPRATRVTVWPRPSSEST